MQGSLTGDIGALTRFGDAVGKLGGVQAQRELATELGDEVVKLIKQGFDREQDPYGLPWQRKSYPDGRKVLHGATGKLASSFAIKSVGAWGVVVGSSLTRARFPQSGTGIYGQSKRRIYPKAGKVLAFTGAGGGVVFARSVKGQQQRRMVPIKGLPSPVWNRALKARAKKFIQTRFGAAIKRAA